MKKVKNTIKAYINNNLKHDDQFHVISKRLNLHKSEKEENFSFMKKYLKVALPVALFALILTAALVVILMGNKPGVVTDEPVAVVQMDVNPSISFTVDDENNVVSVYGENDEGKMIISGEKLVGLKLDEAIEKVITIETETGYLLKGSVSAEENNITISIEANTEEISNNIKENIQNAVSSICDELKIEEKLEVAKSNLKDKLVQRALSIDPTLTEEAAKEMTNDQLLAYITGCHLEKVSLPTKELEDLYDKVKVQKINILEKEETKKVIDKLDENYQSFKNNYQEMYQNLINAQEALNEAYVNNFINEESAYQKALEQYNTLKQEVIKLQNEIANMEDSIQKTIQQELLKGKEAILEGYLVALNTTKDVANKALEVANNLIDTILKDMDNFYNNLPSEIKTEVTESLADMEDKINNAKDNMFKEFEDKYKGQIENAYNKSANKKQELIDQLKGK